MIRKMFEKENPGKFELKPRYWDPEKEEREERARRIRAELGIVDERAYVPNIEGKFREILEEKRKKRKATSGKYAVRMFLILISILLAAFYLLSKYGEAIVESFI